MPLDHSTLFLRKVLTFACHSTENLKPMSLLVTRGLQVRPAVAVRSFPEAQSRNREKLVGSWLQTPFLEQFTQLKREQRFKNSVSRFVRIPMNVFVNG